MPDFSCCDGKRPVTIINPGCKVCGCCDRHCTCGSLSQKFTTAEMNLDEPKGKGIDAIPPMVASDVGKSGGRSASR